MQVDIDVLKELDRAGALFHDRHFIFTSGRHSASYLNLDPLFHNVPLIWEFCTRLIMPFQGEFDTVTAPAVGGVVLSVLSALAAGKNGVPIAAVWAEKRGEGFVFDRMGFAEQLTGKRVLVLEDFLTTGGSVLKVCRAAAALGAKLVGVSVICNRGGVTAAQLGVPRLEALAAIDFSSVPPEECELCRDRVPIVQDIGHGDSYKAEHPDYPGGYIKLAG